MSYFYVYHKDVLIGLFKDYTNAQMFVRKQEVMGKRDLEIKPISTKR